MVSVTPGRDVPLSHRRRCHSSVFSFTALNSAAGTHLNCVPLGFMTLESQCPVKRVVTSPKVRPAAFKSLQGCQFEEGSPIVGSSQGPHCGLQENLCPPGHTLSFLPLGQPHPLVTSALVLVCVWVSRWRVGLRCQGPLGSYQLLAVPAWWQCRGPGQSLRPARSPGSVCA